MKIVMLTQYYPPETGAPQNRLSDLAKRLAARGHQVEVLTALPNYPQSSVFPQYAGKENTREIIDGISVSRVGLYVPARKTFLKRVFHYLTFSWNAACFGPGLISGPQDILFMESPPLFVAFAGIYLAKKWKARLVANVSDLWPQSAVELGMLSPGPALKLAQKLERWMYESSVMITGQTEGIVTDIKARFPKKDVFLFPNGVDTSSYREPQDPEDCRSRYGWDRRFVVGYAGILGHAQRLDQILEAAKLLSDQPLVHFALFGDGPCREHLKKRISQEKISNASIYPPVPAAEMPRLYAAMNAGCVPLGKEKIFRGARPSKMFEMMASGLPILLCAEGESETIVLGPSEGPAGKVCGPEQPGKLAEAVRDLAKNPEAAAKMGQRGRRYIFENFDREVISRRLEEKMLSVLRLNP